MMSANRLPMMRRLAAAPGALQRAGARRRHHRVPSGSGRVRGGADPSSASGRRRNDAVGFGSTRAPPPTATAAHFREASFWSWVTGDDSEKKGEKDDATAAAGGTTDVGAEKNIATGGGRDASSSSSAPVVSTSVEGRGEKEAGDVVAPPKDVAEGGAPAPPEDASGATAVAESTAPSEGVDAAPPGGASAEAAAEPTDGGSKEGGDASRANFFAGADAPTTGDSDGRGGDVPSRGASPGAAGPTDDAGGTAGDAPPGETSPVAAGSDDGADDGTDGAPTEEIRIEGTTSADGGPEGGADDVSPKDAAAETVDSTDGAVENDGGARLEIASSGKGSNDGPNRGRGFAALFRDDQKSDGVVRTGVVKWIQHPNRYAVIVQDEKYRKLGPVERSEVLVFFQDISPETEKHVPRRDYDLITPIINKGQRVTFRVREENYKGKRRLCAFDVGYARPLKRSLVTKDGAIPILRWPAALTLIRKAKASLGGEVYDALSSSSPPRRDGGVVDEEGRWRRARDAIDRHVERVRWTRDRMSSTAPVAGECKARLGNEMYDLLTNIAAVDDAERRADEAYVTCLRDMSDMGAELTERQKEEVTRWIERRSRFGSF